MGQLEKQLVCLSCRREVIDRGGEESEWSRDQPIFSLECFRLFSS